MSQHRGAPVRPRYGRIAVLGSSVVVTVVAVLGGVGLLPDGPGSSPAAASIERVADDQPAAQSADGASGESRQGDEAATPAPGASSGVTSTGTPDAAELLAREAVDTSLPLRSGSGRRVVFSEGRQRVWLVDDQDRVRRTYLVSGSVTDNLHPGTYSVFSRSEQAWGIDDSGTMRYFVRFAHGQNAAIGFHDIPVKDGRLIQSSAQLGTPQSHGCIRQRRADAIALWRFAPLGSTVVVV